jgi:hypothetical protein
MLASVTMTLLGRVPLLAKANVLTLPVMLVGANFRQDGNATYYGGMGHMELIAWQTDQHH